MLTRSIVLRGEAAGESVKINQVRPLFAVDEVSRLNPAGQAALAEFARREKFQLLVTAPAIEPKYDCRLYALTRVFAPKERLIIRGLRVNLPKAAAI
jgi:chromosome condensin MukBEF ATPase and DNA-binding subunit MukB